MVHFGLGLVLALFLVHSSQGISYTWLQDRDELRSAIAAPPRAGLVNNESRLQQSLSEEERREMGMRATRLLLKRLAKALARYQKQMQINSPADALMRVD